MEELASGWFESKDEGWPLVFIRVSERRGHIEASLSARLRGDAATGTLAILARMEDLQFFDRRESYTVAWKTLPHWAQAGTVSFITWRTGDSLPAAAQRRISQLRAETLQRLGLGSRGEWRSALAKLAPAERKRAHWTLFGILDQEAGPRLWRMRIGAAGAIPDSPRCAAAFR